MTPQKIKLTRHDGSNVCPVEPETLVVVRYKDFDDSFVYVAGFAADRDWSEAIAYAVIELVEPDPVIEVGDVVMYPRDSGEWTVRAINEGFAWIGGNVNYYTCKIKDLTLVRKGGAV